MRIFLNMGLTEHTGHGIPTIISKYGKEVFEIDEDFIRCTIPYNTEVLSQINKNVGINVGINVGLTKTEKAILGYLIEAPDLTSDELADKINVTRRTIERATSNLQKKGLIERIGSKRAGKWLVIK